MAAGVLTCQYACCRSRTTIMAALGGSPKHGRLVRRTSVAAACVGPVRLCKTSACEDGGGASDATWPAIGCSSRVRTNYFRRGGVLFWRTHMRTRGNSNRVHLAFCSTTTKPQRLGGSQK